MDPINVALWIRMSEGYYTGNARESSMHGACQDIQERIIIRSLESIEKWMGLNSSFLLCSQCEALLNQARRVVKHKKANQRLLSRQIRSSASDRDRVVLDVNLQLVILRTTPLEIIGHLLPRQISASVVS